MKKNLLSAFNFLLTLIICFTIAPSIMVYAEDSPPNADLEEGKRLYQNFLDTTAFIESDSSWDYCLNTMYNSIVKNVYKDAFLNYVDGATEDAYASLSAYETFIYIETYLRFSTWVNSSTTAYADQGNNGLLNFEKTVTPSLTGNDADKVIDAYDAFVQWQFEYYRQYNYPYNFNTGKSFAEETGMTFESEPEVEEEIPEDIQKEITNELSNDEIAELSEAVTESDSLSSSNGTSIPIALYLVIICFVIAVIVGLIVFKRKK